MEYTKVVEPPTKLLKKLLYEVEVDELTGLWALSYKLSNKKSLDKKDTINLINKINDNLKILFAELKTDIHHDSTVVLKLDRGAPKSVPIQENTHRDVDLDYSKADQIEEDIYEKTVDSLLEILKEKNPLFKIEESLRPVTVKNVPPFHPEEENLIAEDQSRPTSAPAVVSTKKYMKSNRFLNQGPQWAKRRWVPPHSVRGRGIKKSRRKKRKRTKRKRTKRKRTKRKRTKRKRTKRKRKRTKRKRSKHKRSKHKRKRSKKTGGSLSAAKKGVGLSAAAADQAAELLNQSPASPSQAEVDVDCYQNQLDPSEIILPSIYQLRLKLREGGYYDGDIKYWLHYYGGLTPIEAKNIADHMWKYNIAKTIREFSELNENSLFGLIEYFGVNNEILSHFKIAFKMLTLHSEGAGCGYNTGSIVRNLVCDRKDEEEAADEFCLMGCPGPDFKDQGPIEGATILKNDKTRALISDYQIAQGRLEKDKNKISVIILEDENFYETTKNLGLYEKIPKPNQIHIPCIDMQAHESIEYMNFIKIIERRRKQEHMIITHCFCGAGRTSSMIMCCKLYFLIDNILKPRRTALPPYTLLNIPELFGITTNTDMKNLRGLGKRLHASQSGQWLINNYRSYSSRAVTQPGHEFLNVSKQRRFFLFIDRMNAISEALADFFKIPFFIVITHNGVICLNYILKHTTQEKIDNIIKTDHQILNPLVIKF